MSTDVLPENWHPTYDICEKCDGTGHILRGCGYCKEGKHQYCFGSDYCNCGCGKKTEYWL